MPITITVGEMIEGGKKAKQLLGDEEYNKNRNNFKKNFSKKIKSVTLIELNSAIQLALTFPPVQENAPLRISLTTLSIAITTYLTIIGIIQIIRTVIPPIKAAVKVAATVLNPTMANEVVQDTAQQLQALAKEKAVEAIEFAKETALNIPIPIPGT